MPHITESQFTNRFVSMVLKGSHLPNKQQDRYILYISAALGFIPEKQYQEKEVNEVLRNWCEQFGENIGLDHVTLRRALVDMGYLRRDKAGTLYQLNQESKIYTFDGSIKLLDLDGLISNARREREERKERHLRK